MARYYRDFKNDTVAQPAAGFTTKISRSGDSANVSEDFTYGKFLNVFKGGTSGSLAVAWDVLNGAQDVDQLIKFRFGGAVPTSGRYGILLNRYDGTTEATTRGFSAVFTPASNTPSIIINEDSIGTVHFINYAWENNKIYWARFRTIGNDQMFRIWPDGEDEPATWTLAGTFAGSTIANPYSGVGNFTNWSNLQVFQISAGTNGDIAPKDTSFMVPSSTPIVGYGGGYGAATGYGVAYGEALRPSFPPPDDIYHGHNLEHVTISENWTLAVNPINQAHSLQHVALTQAHTLNPANISQGQTLSSPALIRNFILAVNNIAHAHTLEHVILVPGKNPVPDDIYHDHSLQHVALTQRHVLSVHSLQHSHTLESLSITQRHLLSAANLLHDHILDAVTITQRHILAPESLQHTQTLESPSLTQSHLLEPDNVFHGHYLESTQVFTQFDLVVADLIHGHTLEAGRVLKKTKLKGAIVDIRQTVKALDVVDARPRGEYRRTRARSPIVRRKQTPRIHIERQRPHQP